MRRSGSVLFFAAMSLALHLAWVLVVPEGDRQIQPSTHWVEVSFESEPAASLQAAVVASNAEAPQVGATVVPPEPRKKERAGKAAERLKTQPPIERAPRPEAASPARPSQLVAAEPAPQTAAEPAQLAAAEPMRQPAAGPSQLAAAEPSQLAAAEPAQLAAAEPAQLAAAEPPPVKAQPLSILPRAAALSLDALAPGSSLRCANRVAGAQADCAPSDAEAGLAAQAALSRNLDAAAHSIAHLKPREHAKLKRRSDGSYAYDGKVFQALVRPDGTVEFRDTAIEGELHVSPVPFRFTADLNDVVERHILGRELYSAEKQWLLDETRELREQLAGEYRRRELQGANRELERMLQSVLDDAKLSLAKKHEAIFLLWQDCGEDGQAYDHRHAVDRFVRRYMPKGSALGFLADELEHFNASRRGLQKFEPYAGS